MKSIFAFRQATIKSVAVSLLLISASLSFAQKERVSDTWDRTHLYPSDQVWEERAKQLSSSVKKFKGCEVSKGRFRKDSELVGCLAGLNNLSKEIIRLYVYTSLGYDANQLNEELSAKRAQALSIYQELSVKSSAVDPLILATGEKKIERFIKKAPGLKPYDFYLREVFRRAKHTLDAKGEKVFSYLTEPYDAMENSYETLMNAEITWPKINISDCIDDCKITLNSQGYVRARKDSSRRVRQRAFETFYSRLGDFRRTIGTLLSSRVKADVNIARARGYDSALHARLDSDDLDIGVYDALVGSVNDNLPTLHRYFSFREYMMGLDDIAYYDIYPSLVPALDRKFSIEEGKRLTLKSVEVLGDDIVQQLRKGMNDRWMDTYTRKGKRSGAYMQGSAYDVHPYVLMNFNESYDSVSTLAHEWGHVMHTLLASSHQPFAKASYPTFLAEIASIVPETLLIDIMISKARTPKERLYYLTEAMEQIRGTFYRQTMFGEFERVIHDESWKGEALTGERLSEEYLNIVRKYHGHDQGVLNVPNYVGMEWAYIPHFYYNFYVFQYATSMAASMYLVQEIYNTGDVGVNKFLDILKAGGADTPLNILDNAGVDMRNKSIYNAVSTRMDFLLQQAEATLAEINSDY